MTDTIHPAAECAICASAGRGPLARARYLRHVAERRAAFTAEADDIEVTPGTGPLLLPPNPPGEELP